MMNNISTISTIKKERESNFELCRLVCMFYIVFYHLIIHVPGLYQEVSWARPLRTLMHIGVVVFVMISGYFGIRRSLRGFLKIALAVSFYNLFGILVAHFVYEQPFELISLLTVLLPVSNGGYWFITTYVILFLLSPYVNQVLDSLEKRNYWVYLTTLAVLVFYFGGIHQLEICDGRGILAFLLSYSIGHFIHRFFPNGANIPIVRNYPVLCYLVLCTIIYILIAFTPTFICRGINFLSFGYNEIGLYVMSILFFLAFQSIKIRAHPDFSVAAHTAHA